MAFEKYKNTNNWKTKFLAWINGSATSMICTPWEWALFPATWDFFLVLENYNSSDIVIKREIVKCTARSTDTFTIVRWFWTCVWDDSATPKVLGTTQYTFATADYISEYFINEQLDDIQDEVERLETIKLDIDWELRTWNWAWKMGYNDWSWDETEFALWAVWTYLRSWWTWAPPAFSDVWAIWALKKSMTAWENIDAWDSLSLWADIDWAQPSTSEETFWWATAIDEKRSQKITIWATNWNITQIKLDLMNFNSPTDNVEIRIETDNAW